MAKSTKLKEFIANVKNGGLMKASRYSVLMSTPASISGKQKNDIRKILLFCSDANLPGLNISTAQNRTFGEVREAPYDRIYDNVNMTFYVDQNMDVKEYFDDWINSIQNPNTRFFEYYKNYITEMYIQIEDARDDSRYLVILHECYPKSLSPIQIGYDNKENMKLQVSMNYKSWSHFKIPASTKAEPGAWDSLFKLPTINNREIGDYFGNFSGYQSNANQLPEVQNYSTGLTNRLSF
jgi:hypothetical protein